jgi:hypothetical protein
MLIKSTVGLGTMREVKISAGANKKLQSCYMLAKYSLAFI